MTGDYLPSENSDGVPGIFTTTNAGLTWTQGEAAQRRPRRCTGLQFLDAHDGWAVGTSYDRAIDRASQTWVLHTTDGGQDLEYAWRASTTASPRPCTSAMPTHGWLGGLNGVYATTDGGASWQQVAGGYGVDDDRRHRRRAMSGPSATAS